MNTKTVTILRDRGYNEYRVPAPNGSESGAYYTDDKEDAYETALRIYGNTSIRIKFKTVDCFD